MLCPARCRSASSTLRTSKVRPRRRPVMTGDRVLLTGATKRRTDRTVENVAVTARRGERSAARPPVTDARGKARSRADSREASYPMLSHASRRPARSSTCATATGWATAPGERLRSKSSIAICTPPIPSVRAWWNTITRAARPSGGPSTTVSSHSGRAGSKAVTALRAARSSSSRHPDRAGREVRRRCQSRSSSVSVHRGVASRSGGTTTRDRNIGSRRVACSTRACSSSQSGNWSSRRTVTTVERSSGSRSPALRLSHRSSCRAPAQPGRPR